MQWILRSEHWTGIPDAHWKCAAIAEALSAAAFADWRDARPEGLPEGGPPAPAAEADDELDRLRRAESGGAASCSSGGGGGGAGSAATRRGSESQAAVPVVFGLRKKAISRWFCPQYAGTIKAAVDSLPRLTPEQEDVVVTALDCLDKGAIGGRMALGVALAPLSLPFAVPPEMRRLVPSQLTSAQWSSPIPLRPCGSRRKRAAK